MAKKARGMITTCKSYMFKDKNPAIDQLRTMVKDTHGGVNYGTLQKVFEDGGPSVSCMAGWFFGDTLRPIDHTIEAAGRAMGYKRTWVRLK